jgi:hypothetical protein
LIGIKQFAHFFGLNGPSVVGGEPCVEAGGVLKTVEIIQGFRAGRDLAVMSGARLLYADGAESEDGGAEDPHTEG